MALIVRQHEVGRPFVILQGTGPSGYRYARNFKKEDLKEVVEALSLYLIKEARNA